MAYSLSIINLVPNAMIVGWSFYQRNEEFNYNEANLYLLFIQLQYRWANTEI